MSMQVQIGGGLRSLILRLRRAVRARRRLMEGLQRLRAEPVPDEALARTLDALGLHPVQAGSRRSWHLRATRRRIRLLAIPLGCLLAGGYGYRVWSDRQPAVVMQEHALPEPNAATIWAEAARMVDEDIGGGASSPQTLKERRDILEANSAALVRMREGLRHPCVQPHVLSFNEPMPKWSAIRELARIVRLEAETSALEGKPAQAMRSALDGMELGIRAPRGSALIGMMVGLVCTAMARSEAWKLVDKLDAATAQAAASRLEKLDAARYTINECLDAESRLGQAGLLEMMKDPDWRHKLAGLAAATDQDDPLERAFKPLRSLLLYTQTKQGVMHRYVRHMREIQENTRGYYTPMAPLPVDDPLLHALIPDCSASSFRYFASAAQDRLLMVTCALRAYFKRHGRYPDSLQQLVPAYLNTLPPDPFSPQAHPLRYRRMANDRCRLYSIGPDQTDDRGNPIAEQAGPSGSSTEVQPMSRGDIVAGVNRD